MSSVGCRQKLSCSEIRLKPTHVRAHLSDSIKHFSTLRFEALSTTCACCQSHVISGSKRRNHLRGFEEFQAKANARLRPGLSYVYQMRSHPKILACYATESSLSHTLSLSVSISLSLTHTISLSHTLLIITRACCQFHVISGSKSGNNLKSFHDF